LDVRSYRVAKHENGRAHILNGRTEHHWPPTSNSPGLSTYCKAAEAAYSTVTWAIRFLYCSMSKTVILNLFAERSQIQTSKLVRGPH